MKPVVISFLIVLVFRCSVIAQNANNIWCFDYGAAISFSTGKPVNLPSGDWRSCATQNDAQGNLLFHTDGSIVYNSNHQPMPNGTGLSTNHWALQPALIIPDPGNGNRYFIFSNNPAADSAGNLTFYKNAPGGLSYSIVDMTLQKGLGDIIVKNIYLLSSTDDKLTGLKNADGSYWVLVHKPNYYYAFPITVDGIGTPIISQIGCLNEHSPFRSYFGPLKFSTDGKHFANCTVENYNPVAEIGEFNNATGAVTTTFTFKVGIQRSFDGVEFSNTGNTLYFGVSHGCVPELYQLDMRNCDSIGICQSAQMVYQSPDITSAGALQLAPNGKIYQTHYYDHLGVINNPDVLGAECNFDPYGFTLVDASCSHILQNFVVQPVPQIASFSSSVDTLCVGNCRKFDNESQNACYFEWSFPGGIPSSSNETNPEVCYNTIGDYDVTLICANSNQSDTITLHDYIHVNPAFTTTLSQEDDTLFVFSNQTIREYEWHFNDSLINNKNSFYVSPSSGSYSVEAINSVGCSYLSNLSVRCNNDITISPNPTERIATIINHSCAGGELIFTDSWGQIIRRTQIVKKFDIDTSKLASGVYYATIKTLNASNSVKLVVIH